MIFRCVDIERFVDAFLDDEFAPEDRGAFEQHLAGCPACAEHVDEQRRFRGALRAAAHERPPLPDGLRARIEESLERAPGPRTRWQRFAWRTAPAFAIAAAALVYWQARAMSSRVMAEDAIAKHRRDLPVEVTGGEAEVRAWFQNKVDFPVRPPRLPGRSKLRGARLANLRDRQAAYFFYDVDGEKVSVLVFDPSDLTIAAPRHRQVGNHDFYLEREHGYNVALYRDRDLGYAVTSGLDEDRMIQLVSASVSP